MKQIVPTLRFFLYLMSDLRLCSWYLAVRVAKGLNDRSAVTGGTATVLTMLLIALLGVSGALPRILFLREEPP